MPLKGFSLFIDLNYWFGLFSTDQEAIGEAAADLMILKRRFLSFFGNLLLCLLELPSRICRQMSKLSIIVRLALQMSNWLFKCQTGSSVYCCDLLGIFRIFSFQPIGWLSPLISGSECRAVFSSGVLFPRVVQACSPFGVTCVSPHACCAWLTKIRGWVFLVFWR